MRSVSQIYSEAITTRNNYLQLTELNTGRTHSKMSIMNLMTYVVAVCIFTYEAILEAFEVRIASVLSQRINGTPQWYAVMAKMFQYNSATETGDILYFDTDTLKLNYETIDETHRIIKSAGWQYGLDGNSILLRVAKDNTNANEKNSGTQYMPLTNNEICAFKDFINAIKFVGAEIWCESFPGDIVRIISDRNRPIKYNSRLATQSKVLKSIQEVMTQYAINYEFNKELYYQDIIDSLQKISYITSIDSYVDVQVKSWDGTKNCYGEWKSVTGKTMLSSGYVKYVDTDGKSTLSQDNIQLFAS